MRYADLIVLNKTDRIGEGERRQVEEALRKINPSARIIAAARGQVETELLSSAESSGAEMPAHLHDEDCGCGHDHEHHQHEHDHAHHDHDDALPHAASTLFLPLTAPVERTAFEQFLAALPDSVFRAKGFVRLAESPGQLHTFQQVRDQAELILLPLENSDGLPSGLVFIGPHLDEARIRELARGLAQVSV